MPHIPLDSDLPGITGLFAYRPETARPLIELAEVLLRGPSSLTPGERELIATRVSHLNGCRFCTGAHAAFAAAQLPQGMDLVDRVRAEPAEAPVSDKLKALLAIADAVQRGGREVGEEEVAAARAAGASDAEIHDAVLIAAAFCMYNRYVDGLGTLVPEDPTAYTAMAVRIAADGYVGPVPPPRVRS
ncbi:carboxymuconolactone decarboxylase family protein [Streptomyces melanogenes]|uniref:carboxymuconolactone decarboxylase family protein n=1 Tax=Streptomyces melanogenes TaxID=67326 RepID=UPI00167E6D5A|nr:peroxidase-related enzyme [Streptomyces melanogenes]GGP89299.1 carboxymuconolactone decarboxylase [Streptomyces melanogenes]